MSRRSISRMGETQSAAPGSGTPYALEQQAVGTPSMIGLGELEGPEDVILDRDDHLYCGTRHGEIVRFFAPDYEARKCSPISAAFRSAWPSTRQAICSSASAPWGSIPYRPDRRGDKALGRDERAPGLRSSTMRGCAIPTTCDIAPDGRIYFTDSTKRYEAHDWALDSHREPRHRPHDRATIRRTARRHDAARRLPLRQRRLHGA